MKIKFRIFLKGEKRMVYLGSSKNDTALWIHEHGFVAVDHFTGMINPLGGNETGDDLMQFIGLSDKNGVEIYADDILKDSRNTIFRVYQVPGGFVTKASIWQKDTNDLIPWDALIYDHITDAQITSYISDSCEVIGNIHENPQYLTPKHEI